MVTTSSAPVTAPEEQASISAWVAVVVMAGILLVLVGAFHAVAGVAAMAGSPLELLTPTRVNMNDTAWGALSLAVGILEVLAGYGVFLAKLWARVVAVAVATASAGLSLLYTALPGYAVALVVVLDVLMVYAVVGHGDEVRPTG